jgi:NTP pyrophosphatase (non-canonical NTP hydrolase)
MTTMNDYQAFMRSVKIYSDTNKILYPTLGLTGEAGEIANKIKKMLRDGVSVTYIRDDIASELGDALWYIAALADDLGFGLEAIAQRNIDKLTSRKLRGKIGGSGDNR